MWEDIIQFIGTWLYEGFVFHPAEFESSLIAAFVLAVLLWVASAYYPLLFNRRFHGRLGLQAVSGLASLASLVLLLLLFLSGYARAALEEEIDRWAAELARGGTPETARWHEERALETYYAVRGLNNGDLANVPPPAGGSNLILTKPTSFETMGRIYSASAVAHFLHHHPWLGRLLTIDPAASHEQLSRRVKETLETASGGAPSSAASITAGQAVEITANMLKSGTQGSGGLKSQLSWGILLLRIALVMLLVGVQLITFAWNGWVSYQDIRVDVASSCLRT
jgi:hypothetical protein